MRESIPASQLLIETTFYKENLRGTRTDVELCIYSESIKNIEPRSTVTGSKKSCLSYRQLTICDKFRVIRSV